MSEGPLRAGEVIADRYELGRLLGQGGMGAVYEAQDRKFGEPVALKVSAAAGRDSELILGRFRREARIGYRLGRQTGFVRALDWGHHGRFLLYLALDLVREASPLDLRSGQLSERLERLLAASELVARAHAEGVIHRDLKPDNFLCDPQGGVFLSDFGLAKLAGVEEPALGQLTQVELTSTNAAMGTPRYMPLEQFEDAKRADQRADVFALGVMLFEALTGEVPFRGTLHEVIAAQQSVLAGHTPPPSPGERAPATPPALAELCGRALELDPAARLASAEAFAAELRAALRPATQGPPAPRRRAPAPGRTEPPDLPPGLVRDLSAPGEFVSQRDGTRLLWVAPGEQRLGSKSPQAAPDESPRFRARLTRGFFVAKQLVTWRQFRAFAAATGWALPAPWIERAEGGSWQAGDEHPVFHVSWQDAVAYAHWAGLRLLTEAEWEYAARGGDERDFPWGEEAPSAVHLNAEGAGPGTPTPVGSYPQGAAPCGAHDLAGNLWEWVFDWHGRYSRWVKEDPRGPDRGAFKVLRGGSFTTPAAQCRASARRMCAPLLRASNVGFRLAY